MLSKGDDYPIHQTSEPIALAGTDRNFYDRYFFNGYHCEREIFLAAAFGVYPHLNIMDASFFVSVEGRQYNVHASKPMTDRLDLEVGFIKLRVIEPLKHLAIEIGDNDSGITAQLECVGRHEPILEEERFVWRQNTRTIIDMSRLVQNILWSGEINVKGQSIAIDKAKCWGTRDRSWGVRPIGARDQQSGMINPQFFMIWSPMHFENYSLFFHTYDNEQGKPWNRHAMLYDIKAQTNRKWERPSFKLDFVPNTRRVAKARLQLDDNHFVIITPDRPKAYMTGLGYQHPEWGHGIDHGGLRTGHDEFDLAAMEDGSFENLHVEVGSAAELHIGNEVHKGRAVFEQFFFGPHQPTGLVDFLGPPESA